MPPRTSVARSWRSKGAGATGDGDRFVVEAQAVQLGDLSVQHQVATQAQLQTDAEAAQHLRGAGLQPTDLQRGATHAARQLQVRRQRRVPEEHPPAQQGRQVVAAGAIGRPIGADRLQFQGQQAVTGRPDLQGARGATDRHLVRPAGLHGAHQRQPQLRVFSTRRAASSSSAGTGRRPPAGEEAGARAAPARTRWGEAAAGDTSARARRRAVRHRRLDRPADGIGDHRAGDGPDHRAGDRAPRPASGAGAAPPRRAAPRPAARTTPPTR